MLLRTVATCCYCLALGSYVAQFLAFGALLQATLSFVQLALKQLALPDQVFDDGLVCIFLLGELSLTEAKRESGRSPVEFDWSQWSTGRDALVMVVRLDCRRARGDTR